MIIKLDVAEKVNITGWVSSEEVLPNILQADVGCVPHHSNPHTDTTIPFKLNQYMITRKPVLVSSSPPLKRIVKAAGSGLIFSAGDPEDCAKKIRTMFTDKEILKAFGDRGYQYVMDNNHNWEDESAPTLVKSYQNLLSDFK